MSLSMRWITKEQAPAVRAAQCSATAEPRWTVRVQLRQMRIDAKCEVQRECKRRPMSLSMRCTRDAEKHSGSTATARCVQLQEGARYGTIFEPFLALRGQVTLR